MGVTQSQITKDTLKLYDGNLPGTNYSLLQRPISIAVASQWARWRLKYPASRLFTQPFIQGADQRKHQSPASLPIVGGPVTGEFPTQKASNAENISIDDVIMHQRFYKHLAMQKEIPWHDVVMTQVIPAGTCFYFSPLNVC